MCIICISEKGTPQPTTEQIETMFRNNPHGAGYMVARNSAVEIHKGFMELEDFLRQLEREQFTSDDVVVYHFRISTQAGVTPEMTHPFPLTSSLDRCAKLDVICPCGVAHNGIIRMTSGISDKYSDTALFITDYMHKLIRRPSDLHDSAILEMLETLIGSKMAILDKSGHVAWVGDFITEDNGLMFSNSTYQSTGRNVKCQPSWLKNLAPFYLR